MKPQAGGGTRVAAMRQAAPGAAKLLAAGRPARRGPGFDGWDTHANEGGPRPPDQPARRPRRRSAEFESGLGAGGTRSSWSLTEFGRTARINGTEGTDHGTGTVALLAGGAVKGGRVIATGRG